ncbi:amidohydrolase [Conexibacter sp. DBS9H8]|uniref:amidohydrolase family protein n=1 Tax=Conexibacter sp. DBS9H8 TaxID=2937801 RepID=UPI00200EE26E|nr:amidohydrolase family protein [Conexibacter sp. DBS9H8]
MGDDEPIIDAHVHVWRRPHLDAASLWQRPYLVESLLQTLDDAGVTAAIQVTPSPEGYDNTYGTEVAGAHPDRVRIFGRFDPTADDPNGRLQAWMGSPGAAGIRLTAFGRSAALAGRLDALDPFWEACERLAVPVAVFAPDELTALLAVIERRPQLCLIVDHLGLGVYPGCRDPLAGLKVLPEFAAFPQVRVKISGLPEVSHEGFPFPDVHEHLAGALELFGADRLIWGSNHPVVLQWCTYAESLTYLEACEFLSASDRHWLLSGTVEQLLNMPREGVRQQAPD